jgi:hypothetical protein
MGAASILLLLPVRSLNPPHGPLGGRRLDRDLYDEMITAIPPLQGPGRRANMPYLDNSPLDGHEPTMLVGEAPGRTLDIGAPSEPALPAIELVPS